MQPCSIGQQKKTCFVPQFHRSFPFIIRDNPFTITIMIYVTSGNYHLMNDTVQTTQITYSCIMISPVYCIVIIALSFTASVHSLDIQKYKLLNLSFPHMSHLWHVLRVWKPHSHEFKNALRQNIPPVPHHVLQQGSGF